VTVNPGGLEPTESLEGFTITRIESKISKPLYGFSPEVFRYLKRTIGTDLNPDVVHVHGFHTMMTPNVIKLAQRRGLPVVFSPYYSAHNTLLGNAFSAAYEVMVRGVFRRCEVIMCTSDDEEVTVESRLKVDRRQTLTIPLGVETVPLQAVRRPPVPHTPLALLYVGWLVKYKGVQYAIRALKELVDVLNLDARLRIIGDGPYKGTLMRLAGSLGVEERVEWSPTLPKAELHNAFEKADFLLLLSSSEAYGLVVAEALAAGTPCVVSKSSALIEFLDEPGCFGVDSPPDPSELARLILHLSNKVIEVGPFSRKIRPWKDVALDYENVYRAVTSGRAEWERGRPC